MSKKKKKENSVLGPEELREVYVEQLDKPKAGKLLWSQHPGLIVAEVGDVCEG